MIRGQSSTTKEARPVQTDDSGFLQIKQIDGSGADATGGKISAATMPTGGTGILGWLSAIWYQLTQALQIGAIANPSANFTRPNDTTAYAVGDLIANSTTAGSVTPMSFANVARVAAGAASIIKARLSKTGTSTATAFAAKLHLFSASPTVTNGDNGAFLPNQAANYLGAFEFGLANAQVFSDGVSVNGITQTGYPVTVDLSSGTTVYGLLEARGAYTPTAQEVFTVTLEVEQE